MKQNECILKDSGFLLLLQLTSIICKNISFGHIVILQFMLKGEILMGRLLIISLSFIAMTVFSIMANLMPLNGYTTSEISNRYTVLFSPAGYVSVIKIFIYIILGLWVYLQWKKRQAQQNITGVQTALFSFSALFNILWLYLWHYEYFTWSIIAILLMVLSLIGLYFTYPNWQNTWSGRIPISLFLAWESIIAFMNIAFLFTHNHWNFLSLSDPLWTVIALTVGTAAALHLRYHHDDYVFPIVYIWTFIGIAFKNGFDELLVSTAALFLSGVLLVGILLIKKTKPSE